MALIEQEFKTLADFFIAIFFTMPPISIHT